MIFQCFNEMPKSSAFECEVFCNIQMGIYTFHLKTLTG